jgi:hypothetical protein
MENRGYAGRELSARRTRRLAALVAGVVLAAAACPAALGGTGLLFGAEYNQRRLYTIDADTGAASPGPVFSNGVQLRDLASDTRPGSFRLWGVSTATNELFRIDPATGRVILVGSFGTPGAMRTLAFDQVTGMLYGTADTPGGPSNLSVLYRIDPADAAGTRAGEVAVEVSGLGADPAGQLFATGAFSDLLRLDPATAAATPVGRTDLAISDVDFSPVGGRMYGSSHVSGIYAIDPLTAVTSKIGEYGREGVLMSGLAFGPVPEPAGGCALLAAATGWSLHRPRRRETNRAPDD